MSFVAAPDLGALDETWPSVLDEPPVPASELRSRLAHRWVRFHSLPGSRRIPADAADHAEIERRCTAVIDALASTRSENVLVVTPAWPARSGEPPQRDPEVVRLLPGARWMETVDNGITTEWFVSAGPLSGAALRDLLALVTAERTADVLIAPHDLAWLVHPYDGGIDVIARDTGERDALRDRFAAWLSPLPSGL